MMAGMNTLDLKAQISPAGKMTSGKMSPRNRTALRRRILPSRAEKTAIAKLENRRRSIEITARVMIS